MGVYPSAVSLLDPYIPRGQPAHVRRAYLPSSTPPCNYDLGNFILFYFFPFFWTRHELELGELARVGDKNVRIRADRDGRMPPGGTTSGHDALPICLSRLRTAYANLDFFALLYSQGIFPPLESSVIVLPFRHGFVFVVRVAPASLPSHEAYRDCLSKLSKLLCCNL